MKEGLLYQYKANYDILNDKVLMKQEYKFAMVTRLTNKSAAEVFSLRDISNLSQIQRKCFQPLQGPTNSSLLNEIHSSIYERL